MPDAKRHYSQAITVSLFFDIPNSLVCISESAKKKISRIFLVIAISACPFSISAQVPGTRVVVDEAGIRRSASKTVRPLYPEESRRRNVQGVVVAYLEYNGVGNVEKVNILEGPDSEIGKAVQDAVWQWKFKPSTYQGKPLIVTGKLTFYFSIDRHGRSIVSDPRKLTRKRA